MTLLRLMAPAPDFSLHATPDQTVSLSDFRGRPVVLAFYPADWSPVCGDEMALFNEILPEFQKHKAELVGISVDGAWCHAAYAKHNNLHFAAWRQVQVPFQDDKSPNIAKALEAMNALEAEVIAEQRAAAQPKPHRYELTPEN